MIFMGLAKIRRVLMVFHNQRAGCEKFILPAAIIACFVCNYFLQLHYQSSPNFLLLRSFPL